jgi:hypothetical protein
VLEIFCSLPREIFLVLVLQKQKCVLASPQAFPPSRLPVLSEGLGTSRQQASSPRRSLDWAKGRNGSFCKKAALRQPKK